ncbi:hypothetical protein [Phyllobacterium salinisoli]|uniref:hypothetical protein n=1 Tax=Phyllobacterium salinisoli TaxID=1899321 RepID=UPI001FE181BF
MTRDGERLYGRGTTDMKGYLASMLSLAVRATNAPPLMLVAPSGFGPGHLILRGLCKQQRIITG